MTEDNKPKITFAPGCFDNFDGTQEELDELLTEIKRMFESGEYKEKMIPVDELDDEDYQTLLDHLPVDTPKTLQ